MKEGLQVGGVEFEGVSKIYRTYSTPQHRLIEILSAGRKQYSSTKRALDDVSFSLPPGGRLGIVGENGSGKSTLLKVLAGVLTPTEGRVSVKGRISALLELGAGFNSELQGVENIRQFCLLHGMRPDEIEEAVPQIIQFSELREAVHHPVKTYSSGMSVRLGFACAVYVQPHILIVDEALSVGDAYFQNKCMHKIKSMLDQGTTFIYVTHAADSIRSLCDKGLWMDKGRVRKHGRSADVGAAYQAEVYDKMVHAGLEMQQKGGVARPNDIQTTPVSFNGALAMDHARHAVFQERVAPLRTGSGEVLIQDIVVLDATGADTDSMPFKSKMRIQVWFSIEFACEKKCSVGLGITDKSGKEIIHFNSVHDSYYINTDLVGQTSYLEFEFDNPLCPGEYGLIAGVGVMEASLINEGQYVCQDVVDYCVGGARFLVAYPQGPSKHDLWGLIHVPYTVSGLGSI